MKNKSIIIAILFLLAIGTGLTQAQKTGKFTDKRDGHVYKTVKIGSQIWMAENFRYKAKKGTMIYNNKKSYVKKYGYLYNWEAAKQACPKDWHLPNSNDFNNLLATFNNGMDNNTATVEALSKGGNSKLNFLLGGVFDEEIQGLNSRTAFWTSDSEGGLSSYYDFNAGYEDIGVSSTSPKSAFSVRYIKGESLKYELQVGEFLKPNEKLTSQDKQFTLVYQSDGNLVIYDNNKKPVWASNTTKKGVGGKLIMQPDGNLVLYNASNKAVWASNTNETKNYVDFSSGKIQVIRKSDSKEIYNSAKKGWGWK